MSRLLNGAEMTKAEKRRALRKLSDAEAKRILTDVVLNCIHEGRRMLNSSEILDSICTTLRENNLDG